MTEKNRRKNHASRTVAFRVFWGRGFLAGWSALVPNFLLGKVGRNFEKTSQKQRNFADPKILSQTRRQNIQFRNSFRIAYGPKTSPVRSRAAQGVRDSTGFLPIKKRFRMRKNQGKINQNIVFYVFSKFSV